MELLTLTPIHISSEKELSSMEFYVEKGKVYVYYFERLLDKIVLISDVELREYLLSQLKKNLRGAEGGLLSLRELLGLSYDKIKEVLEPDYQISLRSGEVPNHIKCFLSSAEGPYIPGSEVKGALRSLFIWGLLYVEKDLRQSLIRELRKFLGQLRDKPLKRSEVLKKFDNFWKSNETKFISDSSDLPSLPSSHRELFRFLLVADTLPLSYDQMFVGKVITLNSSQPHDNFCEMISPFTRIQIEINLEFETFPVKNEIKKFFNWAWEKQFNWNFFKEMGLKFFFTWYDQEVSFLKRFSNLDASIKARYMQNLEKLKGYVERLNTTKKIIFPLRIGRYQGFSSITIGSLIRGEDEGLFRELFRAVVPKPRSEVNKTRVIDAETCSPLGWCLLIV